MTVTQRSTARGRRLLLVGLRRRSPVIDASMPAGVPRSGRHGAAGVRIRRAGLGFGYCDVKDPLEVVHFAVSPQVIPLRSLPGLRSAGQTVDVGEQVGDLAGHAEP